MFDKLWNKKRVRSATKKRNENVENLPKKNKKRKVLQKPLATLAKKTTPAKRSQWQIWEKMSNIWGMDIGIDLGTSNVLIYIKGRGIVLNEPSYVARYVQSKEIIAVGRVARQMLGRTPSDIEVIQPLRGGVIADYAMTEYMLRYFIDQTVRKSSFFKPRILVGTPAGISAVEKRAIMEAVYHAGARKIVLIEESLAAALGVAVDKAASPIAMVVDIGGGTTNIGVVCHSGIVVSESLRIGSELFDEAIINYLRKRRRFLIGKQTAEQIKISIGTVDRKAAHKDSVIRGLDVSSGLPKEMTISSKDIQKALESMIQTIVDSVKNVLEKTPPEMIADIADHGIILTGGGVLIDGFERIITRSTGIAAYVSESPLYAVVLGTGRALQEMSHLQDAIEELY